MKNRITLKDIAKALNKSVSTISKALSDSHEIGQETKNKILKYAQKHNYYINKSARSLRTGKSKTIGLIIPFIDNNFFSQVYEGIEKIIKDTEYNLIFMQSKDNKNTELDCIETMYQRGVDGLIISPIGDHRTITVLQGYLKENFPIVIIDGLDNPLKVHKIGIMNEESAFEATRHLLEQGYTKILHLSINKHGVIFDRIKGFKNCLSNYKIPFEKQNIHLFGYQDRQKLHDDILKFLDNQLKSNAKPDAIFTGTDLLTNTVMLALNELNVSIPHEIGLIGYCNSYYSAAFKPPLTCVYQPSEEIGRLAIIKLLEIIRSNNKGISIPVETIHLASKLIIRESTKKMI